MINKNYKNALARVFINYHYKKLIGLIFSKNFSLHVSEGRRRFMSTMRKTFSCPDCVPHVLYKHGRSTNLVSESNRLWKTSMKSNNQM